MRRSKQRGDETSKATGDTRQGSEAAKVTMVVSLLAAYAAIAIVRRVDTAPGWLLLVPLAGVVLAGVMLIVSRRPR